MAVLALPPKTTAPVASRSVPVFAVNAAFLRRRDDAERLREAARGRAPRLPRLREAPAMAVEWRRRGQIVTVHKYVGLKPNASSGVSGEPGRCKSVE